LTWIDLSEHTFAFVSQTGLLIGAVSDRIRARQSPERVVEANGICFAYRRFGANSGVRLIFFQHFMGPALTVGTARSTASGLALAGLPSRADPNRVLPTFHVHNDGQTTVGRS
jgi:hypothetical protein